MGGDVIKLVRVTDEPNRHHLSSRLLVLGIEGEVFFGSNEADGVLVLGKGCLVPSGCDHYLQAFAPNQILVVNVDLNAAGRAEKEKALLNRMFAEPFFFSVDQPFCKLMKALVADIQQSAFFPQMKHHLRSLLLYSLYDRVFNSSHAGNADQDRFSLEKIDTYIQNHLHEKIQVASLADLCHLSVSRFHSRFRQATRQSPYQYVLKKRVERAVWLLRSTNMPIYDIATQTGFFSQSALNTAIKKEYRTSPLRLRQKIQGEPRRPLRLAGLED